MNRAKLALLQARAYHDVASAQSAPLVALGHRLGLYAALAKGDANADELAQATGLDARWLDPWLANQVAAGYVTFGDGRYSLDDEQQALFADGALPLMFALAAELAAHLPRIEAAMRERRGVEESTYGAGVNAAIAALGPERHLRIVEWIGGDATRILEIGAGDGALLRAIRAAFPSAKVVGLDRRGGEGIEARDAADLPPGAFDVVLTVDTLHELPDPHAVARAVHAALAPEGRWLIVEPRAPQADEAPAASRFLSSLELLYCLPVSLAQGAPGLGPRTTETTYAALIAAAGFTRIRRIDDDRQLVLEARR